MKGGWVPTVHKNAMSVAAEGKFALKAFQQLPMQWVIDVAQSTDNSFLR